ncbi:MAG TPA: L,D-transpeptidase [Microvirga sp.]|nr:L,D-transpeptidase [Microvirga sp.]
MLTRRTLLTALAASALPLHAKAQPWFQSLPSRGQAPDPYAPEPPAADLSDWYVGYIPDGEMEIPIVDRRRIDPEFHKQLIAYRGREQPGTIVVDTGNRHLYLVREGGTALRYGIGVGRQGFTWAGTAEVRRRARWPGWTPPSEMLRRRPDLPRYMQGGIDNPLGCRALYLYQGDRDTLYRIHGTNEPWTIGGAESSGCIRMLNEDVLDLHDRVPLGTAVVVRAHRAPVGE